MVVYKGKNKNRHHHFKHLFPDYKQDSEYNYSDHKHSYEDRYEKEEPKKGCPEKSCQENLNEFLASVVEIEHALANAINAEVNLINKLHLSPKEAERFTEKLENLIKLAIKKEIILEFLLEETTKACKEHGECKKCSSASL